MIEAVNRNSELDLSFGNDNSEDSFVEDDGLDFGVDDGGLDSGLTPMEKHSELLKHLTDFEPYLRELLQGWLGLRWDYEESRFKENPDVSPIMNIKCATWCISFLKTYARKNNIITTLESKEYKYLISCVLDVIWLNVGNRADIDFGISNDGDIIRICNELEHATILILTGAGEGKYNQLLKDTVRTGEHVAVNPNVGLPVPEKQSVWKRFVNKLKG